LILDLPSSIKPKYNLTQNCSDECLRCTIVTIDVWVHTIQFICVSRLVQRHEKGVELLDYKKQTTMTLTIDFILLVTLNDFRGCLKCP